MTDVFRRLRVVVGVSVAAVVILTGWDRAAVGVAASQSPAGLPPLKVFVTDQLDLSLPNTLSLSAFDAMNNRGDWAFVAGGSTALFLRRAGDLSPTRLLQAGRPIPGIPRSAADLIFQLRINRNGVVAVVLEYYDGERSTISRALCTHDQLGFHTIATAKDTAPDSGELVFGRNLILAGINDDGAVAFTAPVVPLSGAGAAQTTVFIAPPGDDPVRIVGPGDPAPNTSGGTLDQISNAQFNNGGEVLFRAAIVGGSGGFGYFVVARDGFGGVAVRKVVATGDSDLRGGEGTFDAALSTNGVQLNNAGQVAMVISGRGLYISSPDTGLALIVSAGGSMPAPLTGNQQSFATLQASFNDSGSVAFAVTTVNLFGSPNAVLRYTAGTTEPEVLAYNGQPAPDTAGQKFYSFSNVLMNKFGDVSFYSALAPNAPATGGLFKVAGGTIARVVLNGEAAPAPVGGSYSTTGYSHLLDDGSVFFEADLPGSTAGHGAFLATASGVQVLASNADPLPDDSRIVMRNLFMGGAGSYTMFVARRSGGGHTFWTHNAATGITTRVVAVGDQAPIDGASQIVVTSSLNQFVTRTGDVIFPGTVWGTSGTFLFSWSPSASPSAALSKLVGPGDAVPGTTAVFTSCSFPALLVAPFNHDMVVFRGNLSNGSNGIFLVPKGGGQVAKVVLSTDAAPGGGTFKSASSSTTLNYPYVNNQGQVAFWGLTSTGTSGIFIGTAAGLMPVKVAATGDPAPGDGTFSAFVLPGPAGFNDRGEVIFFATVAGGAGGGFFVGTADGSVQAIALNGTHATGGSDKFAFDGNSKDARTNARGDILFRAPLAGGTAGSGLFLRRAGATAIEGVALEGQPVLGTPFVLGPISSTINNYPGEFMALGPTGEVLFYASVDVGDTNRSGVFSYRGPGTLEKVLMRSDPPPDSERGSVVTISQGPGAGGEGLFFLRVGTMDVDGVFADALYYLDTMPPTLSVSANPTVLWPANGKLRPVTINGLAADGGSGVAGTQGTFDVVDEYGLVQPAGTFTVGGSGTLSFNVALEARRLGTNRDGRLYVVRVTVHDVSGNATTANVSIVVPHSLGK